MHSHHAPAASKLPVRRGLACPPSWLLSAAVRRIAVLLVVAGLLLTVNPLSAQDTSASIGGIVKDSGGALIPGARVVVTEVSTSVDYKTVTNGKGGYHVSFLKPGDYVVSVEKPGFQKSSNHAVNLVLNQDAVVDVAMKVGSDTQSVTVEATGTALNDVNSQIGTEFGSSDLINLPENIGTHGAEELLLAAQVPGVSSTSPDYGNPNNISLGGGRPDTNPIIVDGMNSTMGVNGTYGLVPTPDSTEELQVLTAPFSAQYGQTGGGAIITTTRGGTSKFHGSGFEYYNDQSLNALGFFSSPTAPVPVTHFNYFGGSIGGPLLIPRLFNGRKRHLFFFVDVEDTRTTSDKSLTTDVPTMQERSGDFSGLLPTGAVTPAIYDPKTLTTVNGKLTGTQFPGNIIPQSRLDQIGLNLLSYYPQPNCSYLTYNYCVYPLGTSGYLYNADRVDFSPTDYDHIWAKFARDGPKSSAVDYIPNAANTSALGGWNDDHYEASYTHTFSPKITNEARFGYVSEVNYSYPITPDASAIGLKGVPLSQFPNLSVTGLYSLGVGAYSYNLDGHYVLNDAAVVQLGHQTLSFGGEYMQYIYSQYEPGVLSGSYTFNGDFTSISGQNTVGLADLELGLPYTTSISTTNSWFREIAQYADLYLQDDYRLTPRLTLNLGLRWEFDGPYAETTNQMYSFNPNEIDPATGKYGAIDYAGYDGAPHALVGSDYRGFLPRFGFNWRPFKNTVVRGGYGVFELPGIGFGATALTSKSTVSTTFSSTPTKPVYELNQGVPAYSPNVGANGEPLIPTSLTNPTKNVVELQRVGTLPYLQAWQFGIQQDLTHGWIAEVDYQANHGVHLPLSLGVANQIYPTAGCCYGLSTAQSLRPYPQVLNVTYDVNGGAALYDGLLASLKHQWSHGLSLVVAYTYQKQSDDQDASARADAVSVQNYYNLRSQWGTAMTDIPQRLTVTGVYNLPFGAGGRFFNHTPVLDQIIGHFRISTVAAFQVGYPYNVSQANTTGLFDGAQYVTENGSPNIPRSKRTVAKWFNTSVFSITPQDTFGNAPRATLFGPGQEVWNMSVMRDVPIGERFTATFRADAYNAFNHPQFDGLSTSITATNFGQVTSAEDSRTVIFSGRVRF